MLNIITPTSALNRQEAFWYYGKQVATVTMPDGTVYSLEASGEIQVCFDEESTLRDLGAVRFAEAMNFTDEDLESDKAAFQMNNWFAIRELKPNSTEGPDDDFAICHTYTDGIQELIGILMQA